MQARKGSPFVPPPSQLGCKHNTRGKVTLLPLLILKSSFCWQKSLAFSVQGSAQPFALQGFCVAFAFEPPPPPPPSANHEAALKQCPDRLTEASVILHVSNSGHNMAFSPKGGLKAASAADHDDPCASATKASADDTCCAVQARLPLCTLTSWPCHLQGTLWQVAAISA